MSIKISEVKDPRTRQRIMDALQAGPVALKAQTEDAGLADSFPPNPVRVRIRQDSKPLMNKLESEYFRILEARYGPGKVRPQAKKYKLANGCWYCPDFTVTAELVGGFTKETAYEVKGKFAFEDSIIKLKVAAHNWPEVFWHLVWKERGEWREQWILP